MKRPQATINRALVKEGKALAGSKLYRMPMAILLGLAGAALLFFGLKGAEKYFAIIGGVFIACALLSCFFIRKAEKAIAKANEDIDGIMEVVRSRSDDASDDS